MPKLKAIAKADEPWAKLVELAKQPDIDVRLIHVKEARKLKALARTPPWKENMDAGAASSKALPS